MKTILLIILSFHLNNLYAGSISFIGPCSETPLFILNFEMTSARDVGELTIQTLEQHQIPYIGSEMGMNSIFNTPTGIDAMEIISDSEMLAYGWCYKVNDFEPAQYPHEISISSDDHIVWWFGYAHYKDGQWISQCEPSYLRSPSKFCKN